MQLSRHAQDQMTMRGISPASVEAVLIHGRRIETDVPHIVRYELEGLFVVEDIERGVIVTAFHDEGPKKRRKKHGTAKPKVADYARGRRIFRAVSVNPDPKNQGRAYIRTPAARESLAD